MERGLTITGPPGTAAIQWGYHIAARLGTWDLAHGILTAEMMEPPDPVRITQSGLTFTVDRPNGRTWIWPVRELHVTATSLTATLGPKEHS